MGEPPSKMNRTVGGIRATCTLAKRALVAPSREWERGSPSLRAAVSAQILERPGFKFDTLLPQRKRHRLDGVGTPFGKGLLLWLRPRHDRRWRWVAHAWQFTPEGIEA